MLKPKVKCTIQKDEGFDLHGQAVYGDTKPSKCSVVKFKLNNLKTSVRADSSASRGRAQEVVANIILLFPKNTDIDGGDIVNVFEKKLRVESVETRLDAFGRIDHFEASLNVWE